MRTWQTVPWRFGCKDYLEAVLAAPVRARDLDVSGVKALWDEALRTAMNSQGLAIPEEAVVGTLLDDLNQKIK
jgi:Protein of unknown function C-terminus (DUF2399)